MENTYTISLSYQYGETHKDVIQIQRVVLREEVMRMREGYNLMSAHFSDMNRALNEAIKSL